MLKVLAFDSWKFSRGPIFVVFMVASYRIIMYAIKYTCFLPLHIRLSVCIITVIGNILAVINSREVMHIRSSRDS